MMNNIELLVPDLPESVADAVVATWYKKVGDRVSRDEVLVDVETDKVMLEVPAPAEGILQQVVQETGATVLGRQVLGYLAVTTQVPAVANISAAQQTATSECTPAAGTSQQPIAAEQNNASAALSPAVRRLLAEHDLDPTALSGSGVDGRLTRQDIEYHLAQQAAQQQSLQVQPEPTLPLTAVPLAPVTEVIDSEGVKRVPMSRLRQRIAERLLTVKQSTAMLTTFNEVNMQPIMTLRQTHAEAFEKKHGVRLGFMSFYVKAVIAALQRYPTLNACLEGNDILYYPTIDISIAVSTPRGLVTPVLRDCAALSMAEIEQQVKALAIKGRDGKLTVAELTGGNFTITNGGVFGSLMSTPIINPPQSSILGMHTIKERPMAVNGQVVILPMMYLALSYDHRLIDGQASVSFLVAVKESIEAPIRLLLDL